MNNKNQQTEDLINAVAYREFINNCIRKASERIRGTVKGAIERVRETTNIIKSKIRPDERETRADITRKPDNKIRGQSIKTESKSFNDDINRLENITRKLAEQVYIIKIQQERQRQEKQQNKSSYRIRM